MSDDCYVVVIKARDYRLAEPMLDALASEFEGYRAEMTGGCDDIHYEFRVSEHRDGFRSVLRGFKV